MYRKIGVYGCGCEVCGKSLEPDNLVAVCPDCSGIFCKECAEAGAFAAHECEEEEGY